MKKLIGKDKNGKWTTSPSASYPGKLCRHLALLLSTVLRKGVREEHSSTKITSAPDKRDAEEVSKAGSCEVVVESGRTISSEPELKKMRRDENVSGSVSESAAKEHFPVATLREFQEACVEGNKAAQCWGQPIRVEWGGEARELVDGFGLPSPNPWKPSSRGLSGEAKALLQCLHGDLRRFVLDNIGDVRKKAFELAVGHLKESPFTQSQLEGLRHKWARRVRDPALALFKSENQPFYLELLSQVMQVVGDPDWGSLCGVMGAISPMEFQLATRIRLRGRSWCSLLR